MGIFDFLKKIFNDSEEIKPVEEKVTFSNLERTIEKKIKEIIEKENQAIYIIKGRIKAFTSELREDAKLANKVNIDEKEKNDKIKSAVYEGRKKYLEFLERFIDSLEEISEEEEINLEKIMEKINSSFVRFNDNSSKSYERATIVIGKEMGKIRDTIKKFSNEFIEIFKENKEIISTYRRLQLVKSKIEEEKAVNKKIEKSQEEVNKLEKIILEKEKESESIKKEIERIKTNQEYLENTNKIKSVETETKNIEDEISSLRQMIDFKALSNFFHIFENKMAIVKVHRDNFIEEFKEDKGNRLLNLLNESKLNSESIYDKIKKIQDKEEEIEKLKTSIKKDETELPSQEIERIKEQIKNLENEKEWAKNKMEESKKIKEEHIGTIKGELNLMNLNLEG